MDKTFLCVGVLSGEEEGKHAPCAIRGSNMFMFIRHKRAYYVAKIPREDRMKYFKKIFRVYDIGGQGEPGIRVQRDEEEASVADTVESADYERPRGSGKEPLRRRRSNEQQEASEDDEPPVVKKRASSVHSGQENAPPKKKAVVWARDME